ncbi:hypothetical protein NJE56_14010 [Bacillus pumilus]|uniref:hypothetical protein n=1 Tax=Bacillus pumilus TaxID=1408 RepID=UPI0029C2D8B6|nr:hypothetical protein [Bacillus pumilus]MDX5486074.1 hypothetical protein [Bacillus pumilus]
MEKVVLCEACQKNAMDVVEDTDEPKQPYQLCQPCHKRLLNNSLRPIEWYNLAVLHSPKQFLLHDDFYGEDGQAFQSEDDVIVTKEDKAPTLQDVRQDLASLINFSITRWFLEDDVIDALKQHDQQRTLDSVQSRFDETQHIEVKSRMLEIVADVLGTSAAGWVRELVNQADEEFLYPLSWAMTHCAKGNRPVLVEQCSPKILHTDKSEVENTLNDYLQKDGVPRVKTNVSTILNNKEDIFE